MTEEDQKDDAEEIEGRPSETEGGEEVDPELMALAEPQRRGSILRPILFITVIVFGVWIISDWSQPLSYFFSSSEPVDIGDVTNYATKRAKKPDWSPDIPHNRLVRVEGVPSRRSESTRYRFFKLVGGEVYVEVERENPEDPLEENEAKKGDEAEIDRTYFEGTGRAVDLSKIGARYQGLRRYYYKNYQTYICPPEELRQRAEDRPKEECTEAYLIQAGVEPSDHWWYLLISGIFGLFILLNVYWLFRWIRDFVKS